MESTSETLLIKWSHFRILLTVVNLRALWCSLVTNALKNTAQQLGLGAQVSPFFFEEGVGGWAETARADLERL